MIWTEDTQSDKHTVWNPAKSSSVRCYQFSNDTLTQNLVTELGLFPVSGFFSFISLLTNCKVFAYWAIVIYWLHRPSSPFTVSFIFQLNLIRRLYSMEQVRMCTKHICRRQFHHYLLFWMGWEKDRLQGRKGTRFKKSPQMESFTQLLGTAGNKPHKSHCRQLSQGKSPYLKKKHLCRELGMGTHFLKWIPLPFMLAK